MQKNSTNPLIKRILKRFQATAHDTLQGPDNTVAVMRRSASHLSSASTRGAIMHLSSASERSTDGRCRPEGDEGHWTNGGELRVLSRTENLRQVLGQKPLLLPVDQSPGALTETQLEGHSISCFDIEGEKRLCLPQIINCILSYFTLSQINAAYDELRIFTSLCSTGQLEILKRRSVLPPSAVSCGLITKSNAERLCSYLLRHRTVTVTPNVPPVAEEGFGVRHKCFGKGRGFFMKNRYLSAASPAIRCCDCCGVFTPSEFVCHSHHALENRVCHWGFDSSRWRCYLMLSKDQHITESLKKEFEDMKTLYIDENLEHLKNSQSFVTDNGSNISRNSDNRDRQIFSASSAAVNDVAIPRSFTLNSSSGSLSVIRRNEEEVIFDDPDQCKNFAPNVSLLPENFYEKRPRESFCESEEDRPTKCLKMEKNFCEPNISPRSSLDSSEGHVEGEDVCPVKEIRKELSHLFEKELRLFRDVLEQKESLPLESRKKVFDDYIRIRKSLDSAVDRLIYSQRKLQKELFYAQHKVSDVSDEFSSMQEAHQSLVSQLRREFENSFESSNEENRQLRAKIDALTNTRKRSDCGLMKAKYKAQVELFRRKCQSVEQSNKELLPKCIELKKLLTECYDHGATSPSVASDHCGVLFA